MLAPSHIVEHLAAELVVGIEGFHQFLCSHGLLEALHIGAFHFVLLAFKVLYLAQNLLTLLLFQVFFLHAAIGAYRFAHVTALLGLHLEKEGEECLRFFCSEPGAGGDVLCEVFAELLEIELAAFAAVMGRRSARFFALHSAAALVRAVSVCCATCHEEQEEEEDFMDFLLHSRIWLIRLKSDNRRRHPSPFP